MSSTLVQPESKCTVTLQVGRSVPSVSHAMEFPIRAPLSLGSPVLDDPAVGGPRRGVRSSKPGVKELILNETGDGVDHCWALVLTRMVAVPSRLRVGMKQWSFAAVSTRADAVRPAMLHVANSDIGSLKKPPITKTGMPIFDSAMPGLTAEIMGGRVYMNRTTSA